MSFATHAFQFRGVENFAREVLALHVFTPGCTVCELNCGSGADLGKWARAQVGRFVAVDASEISLQEWREAWSKRRKPFEAHFVLCQEISSLPELINAECPFPAEASCDVIMCFHATSDFLSSVDKARAFLATARTLLKPGGHLVLYTLDSVQVWLDMNAGREFGRIANDLFSLTTTQRTPHSFPDFGAKFTLQIAGERAAKEEHFVTFSALHRILRELGGDVLFLHALNLLEFFEAHRHAHAALVTGYSIVKRGADPRMPLQTAQAELTRLFAMLVLRRAAGSVADETALWLAETAERAAGSGEGAAEAGSGDVDMQPAADDAL